MIRWNPRRYGGRVISYCLIIFFAKSKNNLYNGGEGIDISPRWGDSGWGSSADIDISPRWGDSGWGSSAGIDVSPRWGDSGWGSSDGIDISPR